MLYKRTRAGGKFSSGGRCGSPPPFLKRQRLPYQMICFRDKKKSVCKFPEQENIWKAAKPQVTCVPTNLCKEFFFCSPGERREGEGGASRAPRRPPLNPAGGGRSSENHRTRPGFIQPEGRKEGRAHLGPSSRCSRAVPGPSSLLLPG